MRRTLSDRFTFPDYHLLNNLTLPDGQGTTQIDHVLVSKFGIFVLESKHYSGGDLPLDAALAEDGVMCQRH